MALLIRCCGRKVIFDSTRIPVIFSSQNVSRNGVQCESYSSHGNFSNHAKYHEIDSANWKYVERIIPPMTIPRHPNKMSYPSGWKPPSDLPVSCHYFVRRTKNHQLPVYLTFEALRDQRRITIIKHIEGDIWELHQVLKSYLEESCRKTVVSQVNEVAMYIKFKGDHVASIKNWLLEAGF